MGARARLMAFAVAVAIAGFALAAPSGRAADDSYRPPSEDIVGGEGGSDVYRPQPQETYEPDRSQGQFDRRQGNGGQPSGRSAPGGYGEPYPQTATPEPYSEPPSREEHYEQVAPADSGGAVDGGSRGYYTQNEIVAAGHGFFGSVSGGMASAIEWAFQKAGRPNGYILGQDAGGAIVAGLRYGEGKLYTKDAGEHRVYWQGPSVGYDFGGEGSKVMTLVYNLRDPNEIYHRFAGVQGAAYLVGGVSVQLQKAGEVTLAPIRAGVGLRLGANVGYLKYTRNPTWNPF